MSAKSFTERERETAIKKNQEKRRRRRKRRMAATFIIFLVIGIITFCVLSLTVLFKTTEIAALGSEIYTADQIISTAEIKTGDNIFLISSSEIASRLQKNLPFINDVRIKRELSGKVTISVTETREELVISNGKKYFSANLDLKSLKEYSEPPDNLPLVTASKDTRFKIGERAVLSDTENDLFQKYRRILENESISVDFINFSDPYNSYMKINGRLIVKYGTQADFELKTAHLEATLKKIDSKAEGVIDLSSWTSKKQEVHFTEQPIDNYRK